MRVKFEYKNHEGKTEERDVDLVDLKFDMHPNPEYGYQPGWYVGGWDYSRGRVGSVYRSFYLTHMIVHEEKDAFTLVTFKREREL